MDNRYAAFGQRRTTRRALVAGAGLAATRMISHGAFAQENASPAASPDIVSGDARERLRDTLSLMPTDVLLGPLDAGQHFDWIDYQQQFAALGVDDPYAESVEIVRYTMPLGSNDPLLMHAMNPEVEELIGFRSFDVHQVLSAGTPPAMYTAYRGGVEFDALTGLWEDSGYSLVTGENGEYWSKAEDAAVDLQDPLGRIVLARMNNMAILDGTTLVCATTAPMLEGVLEHLGQGGESAAESPVIAPFIDAMPADTVNVMAFPGGTFSRAGVMPSNISAEAVAQLEQLFDESDDAVGHMPPLLCAFAGVTAGVMSPPVDEPVDVPEMEDVSAFMSFLTGSEEDARQAARVAFWRIDNMVSMVTGAPYSELLDITNSVEEATDGAMMTVELGPGSAMLARWYQLILNGDVAPFAW